MSLNIKKEETHRLARELAEMTGESVTEAVTRAVRERLERLRRERERGRLREAILRISRETAPHFRKGFSSLDHAEMLYDQRGLPK